MTAFWREKRWWIVTIALLVAVNTIFFFTYRVRYEQRVDEAHVRLDQAKAQLAVAQARRAECEAQLAAHKQLVETISTVYNGWWSTPEKRLTKVILEVRSLVEKSGLTLQSLNFSKDDAVDDTGTSSVDISFAVEGSYLQLRQLVNMLELSEEFIIIDSISFSGDRGNGMIGLSLRLRTLFKGDPPVKRAKVEAR